MRTTPRRILIIGLTAALSLTLLPAWAATETPVATGSADQLGGSAGDSIASWSQYDKSVKRYRTYVDEGLEATPINRPKTTGYGGGFDGTWLAYQEVPKGLNSDIVTYDVITHVRGEYEVVNTKFWEWEPTFSGEWVLVGRNNSNTDARKRWSRVVLVNTVTLEKRTLAEVTGSKASLRAGQVNGGFASWERCSTKDCQASFYDIGAQTTETVNTPAIDYAPAVADDGTRYFFRSTAVCGQNVRIYRQEPMDVDPTLIHTFPSGMYGSDAYVDATGGDEDLYYTVYSCTSGKGDIYRIDGADAAMVMPIAPSGPRGASARAAARDMADVLRAPVPGSSA